MNEKRKDKVFVVPVQHVLCAVFLLMFRPSGAITNGGVGDVPANGDHFREFQSFSSQLARSPFLSSNQQNQILRDVQQHQHRFQFHQPALPPQFPVPPATGVRHQNHQNHHQNHPGAFQVQPQQHHQPAISHNQPVVNNNQFHIVPPQQQSSLPSQQQFVGQQFTRQQNQQPQPRPPVLQNQHQQVFDAPPVFHQQQHQQQIPNFIPQSTGPEQQFDFNPVTQLENTNIKNLIPESQNRFPQQSNIKSFNTLPERIPHDGFNTGSVISNSNERPVKAFINPQNEQISLNNYLQQSGEQSSELLNSNLIFQQPSGSGIQQPNLGLNVNEGNFNLDQTDLYRSIIRNTFTNNNNNQPPLDYVFEPAPTKLPKVQSTSKPLPVYKQAPQQYLIEQNSNIRPPVSVSHDSNVYHTFSTTRPEASTAIPSVIISRPAVTPKPVQTSYKPKQRVVTTESPIPVSSERNSQILIKPDSQKILQQLIEAHQQQIQTPRPDRESGENFDIEKHLQALQKDSLLKNLPGGAVITSDRLSSLSNLQFLQGNNDSAPFFLGNGQKVKIIQVPNKPTDKKISPEIKTLIINQPIASTTTTTVKPPKVVFEELTKGVLPPGADFEVIRQKSDGGLEEVGKIPPNLQKKVTFVILEEQPDGTVKVQGVRGNENESKNDENKEGDVDSIIKKLQEGEIKLPPSTKLSSVSKNSGSKTGLPTPNATPQASIETPSYITKTSNSNQNKIKFRPTPSVKVTNNGDPSPHYVSSTGPYKTGSTTTPSTNIIRHHSRPSTPASTKQPHNRVTSSTAFPNAHAGPVFSVLNDQYSTQSPSQTVQYKTPWGGNSNSNNKKAPGFLPTPTTDYEYDSSISTNSLANSPFSPTVAITKPTPTIRHHVVSSFHTTTTSTTTTTTTSLPPTTNYNQPLHEQSLNDIMKKNGLFAMSRFLRQSGLDAILNETGPYTVFVPTDRAFRALQMQLGGPDKAEEKFKENPRLLSGLLLHHVVPGAFTMESLQDEMTGVSLAGTQLRVNSYTTQDIEWNDIKVLTVNGAKVVPEKKNILIPQGIAHAVDRVMFPLPVGDLYQTLRSDRDTRFTHFLKAITDSGLTSVLTGPKTYTVFAPVDSAFSTEQLDRIQNKEAAKRFVLRHLTPGTLYSAGMRYYQQRNSMENSTHLTLYKEAGHVKVNSAHVLTRNIPATNGVIHAIDALL